MYYFSSIFNILRHDNEVTIYKRARTRPMSIHKTFDDVTSYSIATSNLIVYFTINTQWPVPIQCFVNDMKYKLEGLVRQIVQRTHLKNPWSFLMLSSLHCPFGRSSFAEWIQVGCCFSLLICITEWNTAATALSQYRGN